MQCTVSSPSLLDNPCITSTGWGALADVLLPASSSKLKSLSLGVEDDSCLFYDAGTDTISNGEIIINDDAVFRFANALATNFSLKVLDFGCFYEITRTGWNGVINAMLNTSSIGNTYNSNHTLQDLRVGYQGVPNDVKALVRRNNNQNKAAVARQKILDCHLSDFEASIHMSHGNETFTVCFRLDRQRS
ncbi:hypothetical protein ACHAWU_004388 [Discostella pseudostelligera]|uniref:Uncharacterized protein n=1 Tax=Discostella pseudostelligera TaxID=259834 RepID=A0ABD3N6U4_9STRA